MAYEHVKNIELYNNAKKNYTEFGSVEFDGGEFSHTPMVIGNLKMSKNRIEVIYLTEHELFHGMNMNSVVGHYITYRDNVLFGVDDKAKITKGGDRFIALVSKLSGINFSQKKSVKNLVK